MSPGQSLGNRNCGFAVQRGRHALARRVNSNNQFKLDLRRMLDRKIVIKQFIIEKMFKAFNIKNSDEMRSNLVPAPPPSSAQSEEQARKTNVSVEEPEGKVKQASQVQVRPRNDSQNNSGPQGGEGKTSGGSSNPPNHDLQILSKKERTEYMVLLKQTKSQIPQGEIEIQDLLDYDKTTFSVQFITSYLPVINRQSDYFSENEDTESYQKCLDLDVELSKKKAQIERGMGAGKLTPEDYMNTLRAEYTKTINLAKFVKKVVKHPKVTKFLLAKLKIVDLEIKELEEFMKSGGGAE